MDCPFSVPDEHYDFCLESTNAEAFSKALVMLRPLVRHQSSIVLMFFCSLPDDVGIITFSEVMRSSAKACR